MAGVVQHSAGILLWRRAPEPQVLIGRMGGPFWRGRDAAAWSIPKGLIDDGEQPLAAALREFEEELGIPAPAADYALLGDVRYASGKVVTVFAAQADLALDGFAPGAFELEWPPRSGRMQSFPEVDEVRWVPLDEARSKLVKGQLAALDALAAGPLADGAHPA